MAAGHPTDRLAAIPRLREVIRLREVTRLRKVTGRREVSVCARRGSLDFFSVSFASSREGGRTRLGVNACHSKAVLIAKFWRAPTGQLFQLSSSDCPS